VSGGDESDDPNSGVLSGDVTGPHPLTVWTEVPDWETGHAGDESGLRHCCLLSDGMSGMIGPGMRIAAACGEVSGCDVVSGNPVDSGPGPGKNCAAGCGHSDSGVHLFPSFRAVFSGHQQHVPL
jgi:hypothetical protein